MTSIPGSTRLLQRVSVFEHGEMCEPDYVKGVFDHHLERSGFEDKDLAGMKILELGPGDSVGTAIIASCYGAKSTVLIDVADCATNNPRTYEQLTSLLEASGYDVSHFAHCRTRDDYLEAANASYLTNGLEDLESLDGQSIDFGFSHAVLEHVRKSEFAPTMQELRRVLKIDGVSSHLVDLKDHLAYGLYNLCFRDSVWESPRFHRSGFYTNRIRYGQMLSLFENAGFGLGEIDALRWSKLPTPREKMKKPFSELPESDLLINEFDIILRP